LIAKEKEFVESQGKKGIDIKPVAQAEPSYGQEELKQEGDGAGAE
jgi:hypothetical protein|tara:strand:+ start:1358 stop:1492 length:135 start_codon:yes stop_codon:yes gene_type:complete